MSYERNFMVVCVTKYKEGASWEPGGSQFHLPIFGFATVTTATEIGEVTANNPIEVEKGSGTVRFLGKEYDLRLIGSGLGGQAVALYVSVPDRHPCDPFDTWKIYTDSPTIGSSHQWIIDSAEAVTSSVGSWYYYNLGHFYAERYRNIVNMVRKNRQP